MRSTSARAPQAGCAARAAATARSRSATDPEATRPTTSPVAGSRTSRPSGSVTAAKRLSYVGVSGVVVTGSVTVGVVIVVLRAGGGDWCGAGVLRGDSPRRLDPPGHLAEGDAAAAAPRRGGGEGHLVAVLEEGAGRAVGEGQRLLPAPGQLDERAALVLRRAGDGAGGEQVPGAQAGAVDGHVCQLLGRRPVHEAERRAADQLTVEPHLDADVESPRLPVVVEVGQQGDVA